MVRHFCRLLLVLSLALATRAAEPAPVAQSASSLRRLALAGPVQWSGWDASLVERAKQEGKPVYVFVGSFLSELSRATIRQSFTNPEVAAFLNANFICVLVDREEQPDVAAVLQHYLRTVKQLDGWPANVWLTPELQPYEGATYLPPSEEWGKPSFIKVAHQAHDAWAAGPASCRAQAVEAVAQLANPFPPSAAPGKTKERLATAADGWMSTFDEPHGGFGQSPKSPEPELLRFLLRQTPAMRDAALASLRAMDAGAIHDPLDGGFFERASDAAWRVPYLQKTLATQARLALAYLDAAQVSGDKTFAATAHGALDAALANFARPDGGFAAAVDATTDDMAVNFGWTAAEIDSALGADAAAFKHTYGVDPAGNVSADDDASGIFKGKNLLYRSTPPGDAAAESTLAKDRVILRALREKRPAPPREDRATAGAHGLVLAALSRAGAELGDKHCLDAAARTFEAIKKQFVISDDGVIRRLRDAAPEGAPADYAALALGCREFARATKNKSADALAEKLLARLNGTYLDATAGRYFATGMPLPAGFFTRAPATVDALSAEALALQAGVPADVAAALNKGLNAWAENSNPAPGDVLLALALSESNAAKP
jgi:uncharacterized protein